MTHSDIIRKLIGPIKPIGKSEVDAERLDNLKVFTTVVEALLLDLDDLVYDNRNAPEASIKSATSFTTQFLTEIVSKFKDGYDTPTQSPNHAMSKKANPDYRKKYLDLLKEMREAFANYRKSEGCSCCRNIDDYEVAANRIAKALHIPRYSDQSGWDFERYAPKVTHP